MTMRKLVEFHRSEKAYMERIALLMTPEHLTSLNDHAPALLQLLYDRYGILPRHLIFVEVAHRKVPYVHDGRYDIKVFHKDRELQHHCGHLAIRLHGGAQRRGRA